MCNPQTPPPESRCPIPPAAGKAAAPAAMKQAPIKGTTRTEAPPPETTLAP